MPRFFTQEDYEAWGRWYRALPKDAAAQEPAAPRRTVDVTLRYRVDRFSWGEGEIAPTSFLLGATPGENSVRIEVEGWPFILSGDKDLRVTGQRLDLTRRGQLILEHIIEMFGPCRFHVWYRVAGDAESTGD